MRRRESSGWIPALLTSTSIRPTSGIGEPPWTGRPGTARRGRGRNRTDAKSEPELAAAVEALELNDLWSVLAGEAELVGCVLR